MSAKKFLVAILTVAIRLYRSGAICPKCGAAFAQELYREMTPDRAGRSKP